MIVLQEYNSYTCKYLLLLYVVPGKFHVCWMSTLGYVAVQVWLYYASVHVPKAYGNWFNCQPTTIILVHAQIVHVFVSLL